MPVESGRIWNIRVLRRDRGNDAGHDVTLTTPRRWMADASQLTVVQAHHLAKATVAAHIPEGVEKEWGEDIE